MVASDGAPKKKEAVKGGFFLTENPREPHFQAGQKRIRRSVGAKGELRCGNRDEVNTPDKTLAI